MPGNLCLPAPNAYRSIFRTADGSYDWEAELAYGWEMIDRVSSGSLAAVILEPILASGGMITLPCGYLKAMKVYCEARGMLLILDEAQTGLGRGGTMFAFEHEGVVPDILTLSKTLGGGMPLSAVVTSEEIATTCAERGFLFCTTHVNDPLPAAVGVTVLEVVMRGGLVERARVAGERLHAGLRALQARYGCIGDVRGRGMFAGLEIVDDRVQKTPAPRVAEALSERMFELGLSTNLLRMGSHERVFRLAPPLVMTDAQIDMGLELMEEALRTTEGTLPLLS
jgi:4-aminobutyrate aminotransferase-like enzyme